MLIKLLLGFLSGAGGYLLTQVNTLHPEQAMLNWRTIVAGAIVAGITVVIHLITAFAQRQGVAAAVRRFSLLG